MVICLEIDARGSSLGLFSFRCAYPPCDCLAVALMGIDFAIQIMVYEFCMFS